MQIYQFNVPWSTKRDTWLNICIKSKGAIRLIWDRPLGLTIGGYSALRYLNLYRRGYFGGRSGRNGSGGSPHQVPQAGDPWDDEAVSTDVFRGTAGRSRVLYQLRRNQFRRDKLIIYQNWASALWNLIKMTLFASLFLDRIILLDLFYICL